MSNKLNNLEAYTHHIMGTLQGLGFDPQSVVSRGDDYFSWNLKYDNGFNLELKLFLPGGDKQPIFTMETRLCVVDEEIGGAMVHTLSNQYVLPLQFKYTMWYSKDHGYNSGIMSLRASWPVNDFDTRYFDAHLKLMPGLPKECLSSFTTFKHRALFAA